ncbi:C-type mannose receptor 2-like [Branchiostoma floridae x Branchiostoma belcheri]
MGSLGPPGEMGFMGRAGTPGQLAHLGKMGSIGLAGPGSIGPPKEPGPMGPTLPTGMDGPAGKVGPRKLISPIGQREYCPRGYKTHREVCYKAFNIPANFTTSARRCRLAGGTLAMPRDAATDAFLISLKNAVNDKSFFWFGLHDQRTEGKFEWMDGTALGSYTNWAWAQPDNEHDNEHCVHYFPSWDGWNNKWNDMNCNKSSPYICQYVPEYCPRGYKTHRGVCYKAFNIPANFTTSAQRCHLAGGTLAMPQDAATDAFLISLKNAVNDKSFFWFGLHDQRTEGKFEWMDGTALGSYNNWAWAQPDNEHDSEHCVHYLPSTDSWPGWNDINCNTLSPYICQYVPGTQ